MFDFCRVRSLCVSGLAVAGAALAPLVSFAQGETTTPITLDSNITGIDIVGGMDGVGAMLGDALVYGIGLAAAIWGVCKCWTMIRRGFGR